MRKLALVIGIAALLAGCGGSGATGSGGSSDKGQAGPGDAAKETPASASPAQPKPRTGKFVKVMKTQYGRILVDGKGKALYLFTRDKGAGSRCSGDCAGRWPPFITRNAPRAGKGARERALGTVRRAGGGRQVTYRGHPLYYYEGDRLPGQVLCQAVLEFGGYWYVVAPSGKAIT
jgi:predicted lipoprotein with Yx(FWY)xxD motif